MTFIRSRIGLALIGLIIIGGLSAVIAIVTTPQPYRAALALAGQTTATATSTSVATATATAAAPGVTVAPTAPSTTSAAPAAPTSAPAGQPVDLHGTVTGITPSNSNPNTGTFTIRLSGSVSNMTIVVTSATNIHGSASSLSTLQQDYLVEVKGTTQANGDVLATDVDANKDN